MPSILAFAVLLGTPLLGSLLLGLTGARRWAPDLNVAFSALTFLAACALTSRVITEGNLLVVQEQFFIDAFNVFLVTLTAFVVLIHHAKFALAQPVIGIVCRRAHLQVVAGHQAE